MTYRRKRPCVNIPRPQQATLTLYGDYIPMVAERSGLVASDIAQQFQSLSKAHGVSSNRQDYLEAKPKGVKDAVRGDRG